MINGKEIEQVKRRLKKEAALDNEKRARVAQLAKYARKSTAKMHKGNRKKRGKADLLSTSGRLPGGAFSNQR